MHTMHVLCTHAPHAMRMLRRCGWRRHPSSSHASSSTPTCSSATSPPTRRDTTPSCSRHARAAAGLKRPSLAAIHPRGHPPFRRPTPSHRAAPLWAREQYPSPQRPRHRGCGGAPLPARSRQCRRVRPCRLHPPRTILTTAGCIRSRQRSTGRGTRSLQLTLSRRSIAATTPPTLTAHTDGALAALTLLGTRPRRSRRATTTPTYTTPPSCCPRRRQLV